MSDLLTHWAVFDDVRRLALQDSRIVPFFNTLLEQKSEMARLGAITRYGSRWMPHILKTLHERKSEVETDERMRQKIAFALGGILHFPADQVFKPMMSDRAQADWNSTHTLMQGRVADATTMQNPSSIREISAYYDCHVFRKVYLAGHEAPFSRFFLSENNTTPGRELEAFVQALFQRALLASHTLSPEMQDFDGWLDNLLDKIQPLYIDISLYTRVFTDPDPAKTAAFGVETDFYRDDDPLIRLARAAQREEVITESDLESALREGANQSGYGECLRMGVNLLRGASAFWRGDEGATEPPDVKQNTKWRPSAAGIFNPPVEAFG